MSNKIEEQKKAGEAFMQANKDKPGVVALPEGLQYEVLKEGTGTKPAISDTDKSALQRRLTGWKRI